MTAKAKIKTNRIATRHKLRNAHQVAQALRAIIKIADEKHDGHFTIMSFTTGFKVMYGTPELVNDDVKGILAPELRKLQAEPVLDDALLNLLDGPTARDL